MDIVELLVLLAFILFPLLQSILEKLGGAGKRGSPPEAEPPAPRPEEAEAGGPLARPEPAVKRDSHTSAEVEEGWSAGWGSWPSETLEELSAEEVVTEEVAEEIVARQQRVEDPVSAPEAARVTVPVVSLESLHVEREERGAGARRPPRLPPPTPRPRRVHAVVRDLGSRSELQRAIVLAEILGPPRALEGLQRLPALRT